jgi:hypothetical protein
MANASKGHGKKPRFKKGSVDQFPGVGKGHSGGMVSSGSGSVARTNRSNRHDDRAMKSRSRPKRKGKAEMLLTEPLPRPDMGSSEWQTPLPSYMPPYKIELIKRLDWNLERVFVEMGNTLGESFDHEIIKEVIFFYFDQALQNQPGVDKERKQFEDLQWLEKQMTSLIEEMEQRGREYFPLYDASQLWFYIWKVTKLMREDIRFQLQKETRRRHGRRRLLDKRCPVISNIITELADYFWHQFGQKNSSQCYTFLGALVTQVATPRCLLCKNLHKFPDWRKVQSRDKLKGPWKTREQRMREQKEQFLRTNALEFDKSSQELEQEIEALRKKPFTPTSLAFNKLVLKRTRVAMNSARNALSRFGGE